MISARIKTLSSYIKPYKIIADVGCDHGYLIKEAIDNCDVSKAFAIDNKIGPLNSAKRNLNDYSNVVFSLSDGLDSLDESVELVVIAGMGGLLIKDIIKRNIDKINNVKRFVLQANKNEYELREFMISNNYYIAFENIIYEDDKYYEIIVFEKGNISYSLEELYFGPILLKEKNDVFISKWTNIFNKLNLIEIYHKDEDKIKLLKGIEKVICK